jgi:hypothetical protein
MRLRVWPSFSRPILSIGVMMPIPMKPAAGAGYLVRSKGVTDSDEAGRHRRPAAGIARVAGCRGLVKLVAARPRTPQRDPARRRVPFTVGSVGSPMTSCSRLNRSWPMSMVEAPP